MIVGIKRKSVTTLLWKLDISMVEHDIGNGVGGTLGQGCHYWLLEHSKIPACFFSLSL
jgi:hypothetical protein